MQPDLSPRSRRAGAGLWFSRFTHRNARFIFPALRPFIAVALIIVYPVIYTGWMSLQEWFASSLTLPKFIGAANYQKILTGDPRFREAILLKPWFTLSRSLDRRRRSGVGMALLVQPGILGPGPGPHALHPAHDGHADRHLAGLRHDVPPDPGCAELLGDAARATALHLDLQQQDGALRHRPGGRLGVDAAHHAHRHGGSGVVAQGAVRARPSAFTGW